MIHILGYISKKHHSPSNEAEECISSEFLDELNRGGLTIPTLSTAFFVHTGIRIQNLISTPETQCRSYLMKLLSFTDAPIAKNTSARQSLANILLKSFVMAKGNKEQSIGYLWRKEKPRDESSNKNYIHFVSIILIIISDYWSILAFCSAKIALWVNFRAIGKDLGH